MAGGIDAHPAERTLSMRRGTNGDTEDAMARQALEEALALLGWSRIRLAHEVYVATHEDDDHSEIARLEQRIKKEFQRTTTKPERFERYLRIVQASSEYSRLGRVVPRYVANEAIVPTLAAGLTRISDEISRQLIRDASALEDDSAPLD